MRRKITEKRRRADRLRKALQREKNRKFIYDLKLKSDGCELCGERDTVVLDFHHLEKSDTKVSRLVQDATIGRIIKEIDKCMLVCANCHRRIHSVEPGV